MNFKNKITFIIISLCLLACQSDSDKTEEPAELKDFDSKIKLDKKWSKGIFSEKPSGRIDIVIDDSSLFSFSEEGKVISFDLEGNKNWDIDLGFDVSAGLGFGNGSLFIATENGKIISLNSTNGEINWVSEVSGEILVAPVTNGSFVAIQSSNGKITALDFKNGNFKWEYTTVLPSLSLRGTSQPIFDNSFIYTGFANGNLVKIETRSGVVQWEVPITISKGSSEIERVIDIDSKPVISQNGIAFAVSYQGDISAIDSRNGRTIWRQAASSTNDVLNIKNNTFIIDEFDVIKSFDNITGSTVWINEEYRLRNLKSISKFNNFIVVGDFKGYLHFISQEDGVTKGRIKLSRSQVITISTSDQNIVSLDQSGKLSVLTAK
ncbi:outer membrane protein assembly factor BamB [SAR86 cluster bacterium]|nr:outer membrane protein assembly factor BamB [SAR86 cluster bacterium]